MYTYYCFSYPDVGNVYLFVAKSEAVVNPSTLPYRQRIDAYKGEMFLFLFIIKRQASN